jgi:hypothetical protein
VTAPSTAREALIAEALGETAQLLDRVERLVPAMMRAQKALTQANTDLVHSINVMGRATSAVTSQAQTKAVEHIAKRTNEMTLVALNQQAEAMKQAARAAFSQEADGTVRKLNASLLNAVERIEKSNRPWDAWLTHAAAAVMAWAATFALVLYFLQR